MTTQLYLPLDCEYSSLKEGGAILSSYFAVTDSDFNIIAELELLTKPDNGLYLVEAEAMAVNGIDIVAHDRVAIPYKAAGKVLGSFLYNHSDGGKCRLTPVGKGVAGDVEWIKKLLVNPNTWDNFVNYCPYEISSLVTYLKRKGRLAVEVPDSLSGLAEYFGIAADWHTARGDCLASIEVVKKLESL